MSDTAKDIAKSIEADLELLTKPIKEARVVFYYANPKTPATERHVFRELTGEAAVSWMDLAAGDSPKMTRIEAKDWNIRQTDPKKFINEEEDVRIGTRVAIDGHDGKKVGWSFFCEGGQ